MRWSLSGARTYARRQFGRLADRAFRVSAVRRTLRTDRQSLAKRQLSILLRLVRHARSTQFGRDHGFSGIQSLRDYQSQTPLRDYDAFWSEYWQPAFPLLENVTWPGSIPYVALSSGTTSGATKHIPVSREMLASNRKAALAALSWFKAAHPSAELFRGKMFLLGGSTDLRRLTGGTTGGPSVFTGDLSGIAAREIPWCARAFSYPPLKVALLSDWDEKLECLARGSVHEPITLVGGVPSWLLALFERVLERSGRSTIAEAWPQLRVIVHGGTKFDPYRELFRSIVASDDVHYLETYPASEGFVAAEDPRFGLLRLIPDHGIFFEFVPVDELGRDRPTRHSVADIVPGLHYAVVLTTCAGLWSYMLGDTVCFEQADPPLLRFIGRTREYLSAFGEHLIAEEVERAVAAAASATSAAIADYHVGPRFPERPGEVGRHRYFVEFVQAPSSLPRFIQEVDQALGRLNDDYAAHRAGDLTMCEPQLHVVPRGGFAGWMRSQGKLGGQHKVPRLDNSGRIAEQLQAWLSVVDATILVAEERR